MNANNNNPEKIIANEELGVLRTEILESEKARIQLLKYKLIAVATLAAIGLGFTEYNDGGQKIDPDYVLCIIPFICAYVDSLCHHNTIRILVIARFLTHYEDLYEKYIVDLNNSPYLFNMEDFALYESSRILSILLIIYSSVPLASFVPSLATCLNNEPSLIKGMIFIFSGFAGIAINRFTKKSFESRKEALQLKADELYSARS